MILLIDNYDSFAYNLYQLIGSMEPDIRVVRNDAVTLEEIEALAPDAIVLSPGPGSPGQAGICVDCVRRFAGQIPILGVCLGHQAICEAFGATVTYACRLMHAKQSQLTVAQDCALFAHLEAPILAARYHSLAVAEDTLPDTLRVTARTLEGEVMAVAHRDYPVYGLQFHPESILTPQGKQILKQFLDTLKKQEVLA